MKESHPSQEMSQNLALECQQVNQWFGPPDKRQHVLHNINCQLVRGQSVACVGPSGCGKTTWLKAILGTQLPKSGRIVIYHPPNGNPDSGVTITKPGLDRGIVFQDNSLFPSKTALKNVAYGLTLRDTSLDQRILRLGRWMKTRKQHLETARALLTEFGLEKAADKYPHQLSGGMQRRVAIAQAMIMKPEILLLDEPFTGLDERSIEILVQLLLRLNIQAKKDSGPFSGTTMILVTHELRSGIAVADRILGISQYWNWAEEFEQFPGATIVYDRPAPVYGPDEDRVAFRQQQEEIFHAVYDPKSKGSHEDFITFWKEARQFHGTSGVLQAK